MKRGRYSKSPAAFIVIIVYVSCLLFLILSVLRLPVPDVSFSNGARSSTKVKNISKMPENSERIGKFGEMMIKMLPQDLSFTLFVPSEIAFGRDLGLHVNNSLVGEKANDTYAKLSCVLGFTFVPWEILSQSVLFGEEITCDSLSGFKLSVSKDADEMLIVNRVLSKQVDLSNREMIIHVMDGVIMDADFEQSVLTEDDED